MPTTGKSKTRGRMGEADADLLRVYLNEIGKHSLLSREDEQRLGRVIDAGRGAGKKLSSAGDTLPDAVRAKLQSEVAAGERATKKFVEANLRLVVSIAKRYQASGLPL